MIENIKNLLEYKTIDSELKNIYHEILINSVDSNKIVNSKLIPLSASYTKNLYYNDYVEHPSKKTIQRLGLIINISKFNELKQKNPIYDFNIKIKYKKEVVDLHFLEKIINDFVTYFSERFKNKYMFLINYKIKQNKFITLTLSGYLFTFKYKTNKFYNLKFGENYSISTGGTKLFGMFINNEEIYKLLKQIIIDDQVYEYSDIHIYLFIYPKSINFKIKLYSPVLNLEKFKLIMKKIWLNKIFDMKIVVISRIEALPNNRFEFEFSFYNIKYYEYKSEFLKKIIKQINEILPDKVSVLEFMNPRNLIILLKSFRKRQISLTNLKNYSNYLIFSFKSGDKFEKMLKSLLEHWKGLKELSVPENKYYPYKYFIVQNLEQFRKSLDFHRDVEETISILKEFIIEYKNEFVSLLKENTELKKNLDELKQTLKTLKQIKEL